MAEKRSKRTNGDGTWSKRKSGTWEWKITIGIGPDGKAIRKSFYGKTQREAREKANADQEAFKAGRFSATNRTTVGELIQNHIDRIDEPQTKTTYVSTNTCHLADLHGYRIDKLTPVVLQQHFDQMTKNGTSAAMVWKAYRLLRAALNRAIPSVILYNPVKSVDLPPQPTRQYELIVQDDITRFLEAAKADRLHALYVLALTTGLRQGKCTRWSGTRWT